MKAPLGTTYAEMDAGAIAFASVVAPLTGCVLIRQRIIFKSVVMPRPATDDSSPITRSGMFFFSNDDGSHQSLVQVPGILEDMLVTTEPGNGVLIDLTNGYVSTFIAAYIESGLTDIFGNVMTELVAAYRQSRV